MHILTRTARPRPADLESPPPAVVAEGARTVRVAKRAAELITDVPAACELIEAILAGPRRTRFAAAIALQAQPGSPAVVDMARRHITEAMAEAALARAEAEVAP